MFDHRADVETVMDGVHDTVGGERGDSKYHRRTAPGCQATLEIEDPDDAWYERQSTSIVKTGLSLDQMRQQLATHFLDTGFEVDLLRASGSGGRGIRAIRDDLTVIGVYEDSGIYLTFTAGPCAVELTGIPDRYDEVEHLESD